MSGILDNKSRILDTIITFEGRRQIANADLRIEYVSFSDNSTYYAPDIVSGSADATKRISFEACNLPQDQITFEADDSGMLYPYASMINVIVKNGKLLQSSITTTLTGTLQEATTLKGDNFASTAKSLLASSIDNFSRLRVIGTRNSFFEDDGFGVGNSNIEFAINDNKPLPNPTTYTTNRKTLDSLYQDARLSNLPNFKFLPPINKIDNENIDTTNPVNTRYNRLGNYKLLSREQPLQPNCLEFELEYYEKLGYAKTVTFEPTSGNNKLVGQFFEIGFDTVKKLDVIDYGVYTSNGQTKHAFFVGKVLVDDNNTHTFIHLFTLVFG